MTPLPWYCWRDGQTYGPFDDLALRSLAQQSRVRPSDVVSNGGAWVPAASVPGLFAPITPPVPAVPVAAVPVTAAPVAAVPVAAAPVALPDAGLRRVPFALATPGAGAMHPLHPTAPSQAYAPYPGAVAAPGAYAAHSPAAPSYVPAFGAMTGSAPGMPRVAAAPGARSLRRDRVVSTWQTTRTWAAPWLLVGLLLLVLMWLWGVWNVPLATIQN